MKLSKRQIKLRKRARYLKTKAYAKRLVRSKANKELANWARAIRSMGFCEVNGCLSERINAHHILDRTRYPEFKTDMLNGVCLCSFHHKFGKLSAHRNPLWFTDWLKTNKPLKYKWAMEHL